MTYRRIILTLFAMLGIIAGIAGAFMLSGCTVQMPDSRHKVIDGMRPQIFGPGIQP